MVAGICGGRSVAALGAGAAARLAGAARGDVNAERTVDVAADDDADDDVPMESILATIAGMVGDAAVGGNDKVEAGVRAVAADAGATTGAVAGVSTGVTAGGCAAVAAADVVVAEEEDGDAVDVDVSADEAVGETVGAGTNRRLSGHVGTPTFRSILQYHWAFDNPNRAFTRRYALLSTQSCWCWLLI
ncbi:hypothetical protein HU200_040990 [Digitaria exilis]|uniref:Uncharacterized protein n=1 Tax=Digitaria exilis TaxID=1010633 RepID=A0A835EH21_9POAL|nr:hypothetical protein HU200_040990 [Digitaria exilis]